MLPKLFKSFTSEKRSKKIKETVDKKILLPELPSIGEDIIVKPTKTERKQKYENKKANVNKSKKDIIERKPIKNDQKFLKLAINGMVYFK